MPGKGDTLETDVLNHEYRTATMAKPANRWIALFTADPLDAGSGAEVTGGAYARVQVPVADASWAAPVDDGSGNQIITNAIAITFPTPTGNWTGPITHWASMTAAIAGNVRHYGSIATPRTVNNGDQAPSFAVGALTIGEG